MRAFTLSILAAALLIAAAAFPASAQYGGGANAPGSMGGPGTTGSGSNYGNRMNNGNPNGDDQASKVSPNAPCTSENDRPECAAPPAQPVIDNQPQEQTH